MHFFKQDLPSNFKGRIQGHFPFEKKMSKNSHIVEVPLKKLQIIPLRGWKMI